MKYYYNLSLKLILILCNEDTLADVLDSQPKIKTKLPSLRLFYVMTKYSVS